MPRVECPTHGIRQVRVPWAEVRSRFTLLMERLIIDLIQQCSTVTGACRLAGISWDEAWGVMERSRKDEKAFRKGHRYHTFVCDLERSTVEFVAEDRKTESLAAYYAQLTGSTTGGAEGPTIHRLLQLRRRSLAHGRRRVECFSASPKRSS